MTSLAPAPGVLASPPSSGDGSGEDDAMSVEASVEATRKMLAEMRGTRSSGDNKHLLSAGAANGTSNTSLAAAAESSHAADDDGVAETSMAAEATANIAVVSLGAPPSSENTAIGLSKEVSVAPKIPQKYALMPIIPGADQAKHAESPTEWLLTLRLEKYCDAFEALGVRSIHDFTEVGEADLKAWKMPLLQQRRFLTAVMDIPPPPTRSLRAHTHVTELMSRAEKLSQLPSHVSTAAAFDDLALSTAVGDVADAAQQLYAKSMEPGQWLEDFRLDPFSPNFNTLGVTELIDFSEVIQEDLDGMKMPMLQQRRFWHNTSAIPHAGSLEAIATSAADVIRKSPAHEAIAEWLRTIRLFSYYDAITKLGARDAADLAEIESDELTRYTGMPLLARRRFLACACVAGSVTVAGVCTTASEQACAMATAAADQTDALEWLRTLRLNPWLEVFEQMGAVEVADMLELDEDDLAYIGLPQVQIKRFRAARTYLLAAPDFPGRRWETPANWLDSLRLRRFAGAFTQIGVDRVVDFAEVTDGDLVDMCMLPMQRRRFKNAVVVDAQPSGAKASMSQAGQSTEARGAKSGYDVATVRNISDDPLAVAPSRWLTTLRIEHFLESFENIGVERVLDFTDVVEEDLLEMGLPLLQRRRFNKAAAIAEETHLLARAAAEDNMSPEQEAEVPAEWLAEMRNKKFAATFVDLGVERVLDFVEVWEQDLLDMHMPLLNRRRYMKATAVIRDAVLAEF